MKKAISLGFIGFLYSCSLWAEPTCDSMGVKFYGSFKSTRVVANNKFESFTKEEEITSISHDGNAYDQVYIKAKVEIIKLESLFEGEKSSIELSKEKDRILLKNFSLAQFVSLDKDKLLRLKAQLKNGSTCTKEVKVYVAD